MTATDWTRTELTVSRGVPMMRLQRAYMPPGHLVGNELFRMLCQFDDFAGARDWSTLRLSARYDLLFDGLKLRAGVLLE